MNADGITDGFVIPSTQANKAATAVAESGEEREPPKGISPTIVFAPDFEPDHAGLSAIGAGRQVRASLTLDRLTQWRSRMN